MAKVSMLGGRVATLDTRRVQPPPKVADAHYLSAEHQAWRDAVIERAGGQCEWLVNGQRCARKAPTHRMFADHKVEIQDGGAKLDLDNGQCLCGAHHTVKTNMARVARMSR